MDYFKPSKDDLRAAAARLSKESEVLQFAREYATGKGLHTGERWLSNSMQEYYALRNMSDTGNPEIMRQRLALKADLFLQVADNLTDHQAQRLNDTMNRIAQDPGRSRGLGR